MAELQDSQCSSRFCNGLSINGGFQSMEVPTNHPVVWITFLGLRNPWWLGGFGDPPWLKSQRSQAVPDSFPATCCGPWRWKWIWSENTPSYGNVARENDGKWGFILMNPNLADLFCWPRHSNITMGDGLDRGNCPNCYSARLDGGNLHQNISQQFGI